MNPLIICNTFCPNTNKQLTCNFIKENPQTLSYQEEIFNNTNYNNQKCNLTELLQNCWNTKNKTYLECYQFENLNVLCNKTISQIFFCNDNSLYKYMNNDFKIKSHDLTGPIVFCSILGIILILFFIFCVLPNPRNRTNRTYCNDF